MATSFSTAAVAGGFRNPVLDAQTAFRRLMGAFAEPGTIADLGGFAQAPGGLAAATATLLATLADADAPVFLEGFDADGAIAAWIAFQTGARVVSAPEEASFAILGCRSDPGRWDRFPIGTEAFPDRSATLVLPVEALAGGPPLELTGPGIEAARIVEPLGLPDGFLAARARNAAAFPRGHDLVLVAGTRLMALPRTTLARER